MRRRRTYIALACLAVSGALAAVALAQPGSVGASRAGPGKAIDWTSVAPLSDAARQRAHREAAARDAARLLKRIVLPPSVASSAGEPAGDGQGLAGPGTFYAGLKHIDRHAWWTSTQPIAALDAFFRRHAPAGGRVITYGSGGTRPSAFVAYAFAPVRRVLGTRWLVVSMVALSGGGTGLRADADVQWIVPRPRAERIPRSVRVLDVSVGPPHAAPSTRASIVDRGKVARIASQINGLGISQPGVMSCPARPAGAPVVTFTFRRRLGGAVVARATQLAGAVEPTTACDPMTLSIEGRRWPPLLGGAAVVHNAQRLLGIRLARTR
jgi:hypothetical protein